MQYSALEQEYTCLDKRSDVVLNLDGMYLALTVILAAEVKVNS